MEAMNKKKYEEPCMTWRMMAHHSILCGSGGDTLNIYFNSEDEDPAENAFNAD